MSSILPVLSIAVLSGVIVAGLLWQHAELRRTRAELRRTREKLNDLRRLTQCWRSNGVETRAG